MPSSLKKDSVELDMPDGEAGSEREDLTSNGPDTVSRSTSDSRDTVDYRDPTSSTKDMSVDKNDKLDFIDLTSVEDVKDGKQKSPSRNLFSERRTFVQNLCDVSVLAANVSQLRAVIEGGSQNTYYWPLIILICLCVLSHIVFGFLLIQRWRKEREAELGHKKKSDLKEKSKSVTNVQAVPAEGTICPCSPCQSVERCDEISMNVMFLIVVFNVAVAGLGLTPS